MRHTLLIGLIAATALWPVQASAQAVAQLRSATQSSVQGVPLPTSVAPPSDVVAQQRERPQRGNWGNGDRGNRGGGQMRQARPDGQFRQPRQPRTEARQDFRQDRRGDRQEFRQERRGDQRDFRQERRGDQRDFRQERREDRRDFRNGEVSRPDFRQDRRDDRRDFRTDRRDDRQDFRRDRTDDRRDFRQERRDDRQDFRRDRRDWDNGRNGVRGRDWNDDRRGGWDRRYGDWRDNQRYRQGWDDRRNWNRGWSRDNRYNWRFYRERNRQLYRLPRYYAPAGWGYGYRRFSIGVTLGSFLFAPNYWINDPFAYRLPPAYGGYRWVRYYDDALLVDLRSGQVVDVVYDIFW